MLSRLSNDGELDIEMAVSRTGRKFRQDLPRCLY